jgi:hypothetical protein
MHTRRSADSPAADATSQLRQTACWATINRERFLMATTKLPSFVVVLLALLGCEHQSIERMDDTQGDAALSEAEPSFADAGGGGDGAAPTNPKAPTVAELCAPQTNPPSGGLTTPRPEPECMGKACGDSCDPCVGLQPGVCETIPKGDYACNVWGGCFLVKKRP